MPPEYAFSICKPDSLERRLVGELIGRIEQKGLDLVDIAYRYATRELIEATYPDRREEPGFEAMAAYMMSGPLIAAVWQGEEANKALRLVIGTKNPLESPPGSIRGDFAADPVRTIIHGSRSPAEAWREIGIWFPDRFDGLPPEPEKSALPEEGERDLTALGLTLSKYLEPPEMLTYLTTYGHMELVE